MPTSNDREKAPERRAVWPVFFTFLGAIYYTVGIAYNNDAHTAKVYFGMQLAMALYFILVTFADPWNKLATIDVLVGLFGIASFVLGWIWFANLTGYSFIGYAQTFGPGAWVHQLTTGLALMYFMLWLHFVSCCILAVAITLFMCSTFLACCL